MVVKTRESNENKLSYLLREYGLENRKINNFSEIEEVTEADIDCEDMNKRVSEKRKYSLNYLRNALELCK